MTEAIENIHAEITVEEVRRLRSALQRNLLSLILSFEKETGLFVRDARLSNDAEIRIVGQAGSRPAGRMFFVDVPL